MRSRSLKKRDRAADRQRSDENSAGVILVQRSTLIAGEGSVAGLAYGQRRRRHQVAAAGVSAGIAGGRGGEDHEAAARVRDGVAALDPANHVGADEGHARRRRRGERRKRVGVTTAPAAGGKGGLPANDAAN